jgi:hypothetical protein
LVSDHLRPFALWTAFPSPLAGRNVCDYYNPAGFGLRLNGEDVNLDVLVAEVGLEWRAVFENLAHSLDLVFGLNKKEHCERNASIAT